MENVAETFTLAFGQLPPSELARRFRTLGKVTAALNQGDVARAAVLALLMRLPVIPQTGLARLADAPHLRKYNPDQPRVPAGNPDGGEWTSEDGDTSTGSDTSNSSTAQAIPMPLELPFPPRALPMPPTEILPPPIYPLTARNPYPDDPECVQEWEAAWEFCEDQERRGNLKPGYGGFGADFNKCVLGQVSASCGGNPTA